MTTQDLENRAVLTDHEQRIADLIRPQWRRARREEPEIPRSLARALEICPTISAAELRELARRRYRGPVVSLYLTFTPERLVRTDRPVFLSVVNSLIHRERAARQAEIAALEHAQRVQLQRDLEEIEAFLLHFEPAHARSLVIFKSGEELNRVMTLPVRTIDSLTIDVDPYVSPLESLLESHHRVLLVEVTRHEGNVSIYQLGHLRHIGRQRTSHPSKPVEASRPGKAQRHRLTHLQWHLRAVAHMAAAIAREEGTDLVALRGDEELLVELRDFLPLELRQAIVVELPEDPEATRAEVMERIEAALAKLRETEEARIVERLAEARGHGKLAVGLPAVIEAANLFLVRQLVVDRSRTRPGWVCRRHHYLALDPGVCPWCEEPLVGVENVVDELVEFAWMHGVELHVIDHRPELMTPYEGIAAVTYLDVVPTTGRAPVAAADVVSEAVS